MTGPETFSRLLSINHGMRWRMVALCTLLCVAVLARECVGAIVSLLLAGSAGVPRIARSDAESLLAQGRKLALGCVTAEDLELLPGVTDRLSTQLLKAAPRIAYSAEESGTESALQQVHGVGPKRAAFLSTVISLHADCDPDDRVDGNGTAAKSIHHP